MKKEEERKKAAANGGCCGELDAANGRGGYCLGIGMCPLLKLAYEMEHDFYDE